MSGLKFLSSNRSSNPVPLPSSAPLTFKYEQRIWDHHTSKVALQHQWKINECSERSKWETQTRSSKSPCMECRPGAVLRRPHCSTLLASHPRSRQLVTSRLLMQLNDWEALQWALPQGSNSQWVTISGPAWPDWCCHGHIPQASNLSKWPFEVPFRTVAESVGRWFRQGVR